MRQYSMAANPYDLTAGEEYPKGKRYPATNYNAEDIVELTEGYHRIDEPERWRGVPRGSHVRLLKVDGKFLPGGFVHNYYKSKDTGEEAFFIENMFNEKNPDYFKFKIPFKSIKTLWKRDDKTLVSVADFAGIAEELVKRLAKAEDDIARLTKIVGKLASAMEKRR